MLASLQTRSATSAKRGFTLIELLIVMSIIAILAAIAYPSYTAYVARGYRANAQSYMMEMAQRQVQIFADTRSYATEAEIKVLLPVPANVARGYAVTVTDVAGPPKGFLITATPIATSTQKNEATLTLNHDGKKEPEKLW